jgi:glycopeptide antibiotics resistance protein
MSIIQKGLIFLIQYLSIIGFVYFHTHDLDNDSKKQCYKYMHIVLFIVYLINLFYVLLLDYNFGRNAEVLVNYDKVNLELFKTIDLYIHGYQMGTVQFHSLFINIVGNFVLFMPMTYFLYYFFKSQRKWYVFFLTIAIIVLCVEVLQVIVCIGTGDIDDWLLNVSGAFLFYLLLSKKGFRK